MAQTETSPQPTDSQPGFIHAQESVPGDTQPIDPPDNTSGGSDPVPAPMDPHGNGNGGKE